MPKKELPDGTTYEVGEPVVTGAITPRVELEVLPASPNAGQQVGFSVSMYSGSEVYLLVDGKMVETPITARDGLKVGDTVACPSLMGYFRATIKAGKDGALYAESPNEHVGFLEFDTDDRHCWTCASTANMRSIKRLEIYR